uniref:Uncharacterized protein n=1 Tax=Opuntia streptacantha TaxID=393608 RepID=A0A7C9EIP5_OPUST
MSLCMVAIACISLASTWPMSKSKNSAHFILTFSSTCLSLIIAATSSMPLHTSKSLKIGKRLCEAEELNHFVGISYGVEKVKEATKAANTKEREFGAGVSESGSESERDLSV